MMDGIPESVSVAYSITVTNTPFFAYSFRKIALPIPIGVAIIIVITMISTVFKILPAIPTVPLSTDVTPVKNERLTVDAPFIKTNNMIPSRRIIDRDVESNTRPINNLSAILPFVLTVLLIQFPPSCLKQDEVYDHYKNVEDQTDGKQYPAVKSLRISHLTDNLRGQSSD